MATDPLPFVDSASFQFMWENADLVCAWIPPSAASLPTNRQTRTVAYINANDAAGHFKGQLVVVCPSDLDQIVVPPEVLWKLRQVGSQFHFHVAIMTDNLDHWAFSDAKTLSFSNPNFGPLTGRLGPSVQGVLSRGGVAGATVSVVGTGHTTTTGPDGNFAFPAIPVGSHILNITSESFKGKTVGPIEVHGLGITAHIPFIALETLNQGDITDAVLEERLRYDPSGNGIVELEEAIRALQTVSGMRAR